MTSIAKTRNSITVPQLAWCGDIDAELVFPEKWEVVTCTWPGATAPKLTGSDFRRALADPIASKPLRELARGKKNVVILFDDLARPTKTHDILPFVLEELAAAGVDDDDIQFICALGCHGAHTAADFRKKLGDEVVGRFRVYNHNIYDNCTYLGKTSRGTRVSLNTEFVNADLKIGIGGIVPHPSAGFGGGAKIVLPGIASVEAILDNHQSVTSEAKRTGRDADIGYGSVERNAVRLDMDEICRMSGLDFKIDVLINGKRDCVAVFAGRPVDQYYEGVKVARERYRTARVQGPEVVVVNCYAKTNEPFIGVWLGQELLSESGGTLVMISNNPYGDVPHYIGSSFGKNMGGPLWQPPVLSPRIKKLIVLMPYRTKASGDWFAPAEAINWASNWDEVVTMLQADYPGGAKVAVLPDGTIQYF